MFCIIASERQSFDSHFIGSEVTFIGVNPSTWTLVKKLSERHTQEAEYEYEESKCPSFAWALFQCRDSHDSSNTAIMKIYIRLILLSSCIVIQILICIQDPICRLGI